MKTEHALKERDIISLKDLSREEMDHLFESADDINIKQSYETLKGKIMATLFWEPSTRTRLSFESAMHRLGGDVIGFADPSTARAGDPSWQETLEDTIRMVDLYSDVIVMRHPTQDDAARVAAECAEIPVISGGVGWGPLSEHPTQALLDMYTIRVEKGSIDGVKIALVGNLLNPRTLHSLGFGLAKYDCELILSAPEGFEMPEVIVDYIRRSRAKLTIMPDLDEALRVADVMELDVFLPMSLKGFPISKKKRLLSLVEKYRFVPETLKDTKEGFILLHSLPRTDEFGFQIDPEVDKMVQARYFEEAANGPKIRMALLNLLLA